MLSGPKTLPTETKSLEISELTPFRSGHVVIKQDDALATDDKDAALWLIRGRLALAEGRPDEAGHYMERALELGFPRERLTPWLAEVAFLRGDYAQTSQWLATLGNAAALPTLKPAVTYWSS